MLCEFWLEGMGRVAASIPAAVIESYLGAGAGVDCSGDEGPTPTTPDAAVQAAAGWEGRWVNLVLRVP